MFHIGKVIEVISPTEKGAIFSENNTNALIEMWDENLIIFRVNNAIAKELKAGNYVLIDYSPVSVASAPVPRHEIVSIVPEAKGKKVFEKMQDYLESKKNQRAGTMPALPGKMIG